MFFESGLKIIEGDIKNKKRGTMERGKLTIVFNLKLIKVTKNFPPNMTVNKLRH